MFKKTWKWLKQYHTTILTFLFILSLGAGIAPTIKHGKNFVTAIRYEQMAEIVPAYAVAGEMEIQFGVYVLDIETIGERFVVAWILPPTYESEDAVSAVYTFFALLAEHYPDYEVYYVVIAETFSVTGVDGTCTAARGMAEYGMANSAVQKLLAWGEENAESSLDTLFETQEFWATPCYQNPPYLESLLQREPGHIPPWKEAE